MVKRIELPGEELRQQWKQGVSCRELAKRYGVSEMTVRRRLREEDGALAPLQLRMREAAARLQTQVEQRMQEELDTKGLKELSGLLRELLRLQQELQPQQGETLRVILEGETEAWSV